MIECFDQLQISILERLDHLEMLLLDLDQMAIILKDDEKKRAIVKNFRVIKASEKGRSHNELKCLNLLSRINKKMTRNQINVCQRMFVNCMNQYLNSEYEVINNGQVNAIINAFIFYYQNIKAQSKVKQLIVTKNCGLFYQINFLYENFSFFISNIRQSLDHVYEKQKIQFFNLLKTENKGISPEKRFPDDEDPEKLEKFDKTGINFNKKRRNLQNYCFQLSKVLQLQHIYIDYFYFSSMEFERRRKILQGNFLKRNIHTLKSIEQFDRQYQFYRSKRKSIKRDTQQIK